MMTGAADIPPPPMPKLGNDPQCPAPYPPIPAAAPFPYPVPEDVVPDEDWGEPLPFSSRLPRPLPPVEGPLAAISLGFFRLALANWMLSGQSCRFTPLM